MDTRNKIGSAKICSGLYLLKCDMPLKRQTHNKIYVPFKGLLALNFLVNKDSAIMLWHYHHGHPNFMYLKKLVPSLFTNKSLQSFKCEISQLSKHIRSSYPIISYKPSHPFAMIYSDV